MSKLVMVTDEIRTILKRESERKTYTGVAEELGVSKTWVIRVSAGEYGRIRQIAADRVFAMAGINTQPDNALTPEQLKKTTNDPWFQQAIRKHCLNYGELEPKIRKIRNEE